MKILMKNPVFMIGMLIAIIVIMDLQRRGIFGSYRDSLNPTSCRAVRVNLKKRVPENWKTECVDGRLMTPSNKDLDIDNHNPNDLVVNIQNPLATKFTEKLTDSPKDRKVLEDLLYNRMANSLVQIARYSPLDILKNVGWVIVRMHHKDIILAARTKGMHIVKLATLTNKDFISQHLQNTVEVQTNKAIK